MTRDQADPSLPVATTHDLDSRAAIHDLVVRFYREIVFDELLEPVFGQVAEVDWAVHLPKLTDFWCRVLLGERGYDGFVLGAHRHVHDIEPLTPEMFDRWYGLWVTTIDGGWSGPMAETAKQHAARIGAVLANRVMDVDWTAPGSDDPGISPAISGNAQRIGSSPGRRPGPLAVPATHSSHDGSD